MIRRGAHAMYKRGAITLLKFCVFQAHRRLYHSTLDSRMTKNKKIVFEEVGRNLFGAFGGSDHRLQNRNASSSSLLLSSLELSDTRVHEP